MKRLFISTVLTLCFGISLAQGVFTTRDAQLIDASGQPFVIAGINNPHAWFGERAYQALDDIAATQANTVRIVWNTRGKANQLERIIKRCIALKMIPMVELHDVTGNSSGQRLLDMASYYSRDDIKAVLKRHERYLLINIANEWGEHDVTTEHWLQSYSDAVAAMRKAGFTTTLVVDAPGWGQNIRPVLEGGRQLIANDSLHNILFSVHMYGSWNNPQDIIDKLTAAKEKSLPMIVGEFGYNFNDGQNNLKCKTDHRTIMATCQKLGYGFMPWSWTGNNKANGWLDIVDSRDWKTPTWWGREVIDGECGIRRTARPAAVLLNACQQKRPTETTNPNNLFSALLGKSEAEVQARIDSVWTHFFTPGDISKYDADGEKCVYYEVGDSMGIIVDTEGMAGANAVGAFALADSNNEEDRALAREYVQRLWDVEPPTGKWRYYVGMVYFLSMLHVSGNFTL